MKVKVTTSDIQRAIERPIELRSTSCPIAQALRRQCHLHLNQVAVGNHVVTIMHEMRGWGSFRQEAVNYELPWEAIEFISHFDYGRFVQPFEFEMKERKRGQEE